MKRKRIVEEPQSASTPKRTRLQATAVADETTTEDALHEGLTPPKRKRGRPPKTQNTTPVKAPRVVNGTATVPSYETPKSHRKVIFSTPSKIPDEPLADGTPTIVRNADRSAKRKSARALIQRNLSDGLDAEEALDEEDELAQDILGANDEEDDVDGEGALDIDAADLDQLPETPSKRGRGRPKGKRKARSPTPPINLPPHERYFFDNRPGGTRTSNNTLSSVSLLNHDEYFEQISAYEDPHRPEQEFLHSLHSRSFEQWAFKLSEGFSICLYGFGSKRSLSLDFATYLCTEPTPLSPTSPKIVVVNGFNPSVTLRSILTTLASMLVPRDAKLPTQVSDLLTVIRTQLSTNQQLSPIVLLIHNLDSPSLRTARTISTLATLLKTCRPHISLLATVDTPSFPLLFPLPILSSSGFRFLFHDCTTFAPWVEGEEINSVDAVNELLGRQGRRAVGGREGVGFVLRSLPENARHLFRVLVAEQLAALDVDPLPIDLAAADEDDMMEGSGARGKISRRAAQDESEGAVEYRMLYQKASEEFICSSEMAFRQLLKEFHDHQMVCSRRDRVGGEVLWVPFRKEELEALLEDIVE